MAPAKTRALAIAGGLLLAGLAIAVKMIWFPGVDEAFFQLDYQRLEQAPSHVLILRPTQFGESRRSGCLSTSFNPRSGTRVGRMVGRNVSLAEVIAIAYQCPASRVAVPAGAPTNRYDFLVTLTGKPAEHFRDAIKRKLGWTARSEERSADVLLLKVRTPNSPGLKPSNTGDRDATYMGGKLHFRHAPLQQVLGMIEERFQQPVFDETGLTGFYDYAMDWQGPGRNKPTEDQFKASLADMGLALVPDKRTLRLTVVEKAK